MAHQNPNWEGIRTPEDFKEKYFTDQFEGKLMDGARAVRTWEGRTSRYGDPSKKDKANPVETEVIQVPGCGKHQSESMPLRIHTKMAPLILAAFERIKELNEGRYVIKKVGGFNVRYAKTKWSKANIRDNEADYGGCSDYIKGADRQDTTEHKRKWAKKSGAGAWAAKAFNYDVRRGKLKKGRISNHSFGTAFDINSATNDFKKGVKFDLPPWLVQVF
ncbi:M15 family metallopeptidase, partial [Planctomycetota bacterium]|nr:M15 family metallopeptidase [Planctomycetota bacterium]